MGVGLRHTLFGTWTLGLFSDHFEFVGFSRMTLTCLTNAMDATQMLFDDSALVVPLAVVSSGKRYRISRPPF